MKKGQSTKRSVPVTFYVTPEQLEMISIGHAKSIYRKLSEYLRAFFIEQRVGIFYRNQSFDDFMSEAVRLRKLLENIREQMADGDGDRRMLVVMDEIKTIMIKIYEICMPM